MMKQVKLMLKGISEENGVPFTKEIHTLDEVKSCGNYRVVGRNVSAANGMPSIVGKTHDCFCCEAQLTVTCCYPESESQSDTTYGQCLTISDRETGKTATYTRSISPNNNGQWGAWKMVATGDAEIIAANNDVNERISMVAATLREEINDAEVRSQTTVLTEAARAQAAEEELNSRKADEGGYHPKMTTGFSDNLVGRGEAVEDEFTYRASAGTKSIEDGVARIERIKGNSIVWNQLAKVQESVVISGVTIESVGDGSYKVSTMPDTPSADDVLFPVTDSLVYGRKVIFCSSSTNIAQCTLKSEISNVKDEGNGGTISSTVIGERICIYVPAGTIINTAITIHPQAFDLTQMFGSGKEPSSEEFKMLYPFDYEYNAGELRHLNIEAIKTIGFNRLNLMGREKTNFGENNLSPNSPKDFSEKYWYDGFSATGRYDASKKYIIDYADDNSIKATFLTATPDTGSYGIGFPIRVLPNTTYTFKAKINVGKWNVMFATKDGLSLGYWELVYSSYQIPMPINCCWAILVFIADDNSKIVDIADINISLTHSGYRDKEYEDYKELTRELPVVKECFPDGMKSAGNAFDELTSEKAVKRIKAVDLGSCNWNRVAHVSDSGKYQFYTVNVLDIAQGGNLFSTDFFGRNSIGEVADNPNGTGAFVTEHFALHVTNPKYNTMTATEFKEAMAGVVMLYETTKPETVVFDDYVNLDYEVCDFGTEEAVCDGNSAPFKVDIVYGFNAVDTIRNNRMEIKALLERIQLLEEKAK